ncbi:amidohydrolase [Guptibacillus algicola]|uniref:amidohydrolase n=1 Tax=Guptibacillus algicola TaxID=225844 RepID=UPI001CD283DC|nr:amidohydrolase [Alkalihalobacillus algicola]MCA0986365.1 amidohydrolase [Alkalihalobacillus algicola]
MGKLWFGGKIYTLINEVDTVEAVYTEGGQVVKTGTFSELTNEFGKNIHSWHDLKGNVMIPGFVDSHLHMIGHGEKLLRLDLSQVDSAEEMKRLLIEKANESAPDEWIIGEGWNENNFSDRKIFHRDELDRIAPNNPMMLTRVCRHAILANSIAMDLAGITDETPDPEGGVIMRDNDGRATGYLLDKAQELVKDAMPEVSLSFLEKALTSSVDDLVSKGVTGGHSEDLNYYGGFTRTYKTFLNVINGTRKFRANLLVHHEVIEEMRKQGLGFGDGTEYVELGAMKLFADGALGGRTALLRIPYNDSPDTSGVAIHSVEGLEKLVQKARAHHMPVAIHVIGDLALEYAIDAIEKYPPPQGLRDRLIHTQVINQDLVDRLKQLPVILDIQPRFVASDFPWVMERLGEERMEWSFAWKTLIDSGVAVAGGSDAPIEPVDPLLGIHAAVTRKRPNDTHDGYYPKQKLSVYEAVCLFTKGSAFAIGKEKERGEIKEGMDADFTVLNRDIFTCDADLILRTKAVMTIIDETIQYCDLD